MAVRVVHIITIFLEFLRLTTTTRRREVKERVDPLTKYDASEFHTRFRLSKLTVHHLLSDVCQTVHLLSFCNIIVIAVLLILLKYVLPILQEAMWIYQQQRIYLTENRLLCYGLLLSELGGPECMVPPNPVI